MEGIMDVNDFKKTPEGKKIYNKALEQKQAVINAETQLHLHYLGKEINGQKNHCHNVTTEIFPRIKNVENAVSEHKGSSKILIALVVGLSLTIGSLISGYLFARFFNGVG